MRLITTIKMNFVLNWRLRKFWIKKTTTMKKTFIIEGASEIFQTWLLVLFLTIGEIFK